MKEPEAARLLIVDDEESIRQVCRRVLVKHGHSVETAADADAALEWLERENFDLVITDIAMPGPLNGVGLLQEIKKRWPPVDVMLMTAYPSLDTVIPTLRAGADDYLIKPFDQDHLRTVVDRWVQKRGAGEPHPGN